uniref:Uncharacterized protein n=1 Tax=Candidatus Kentrum sp. LFY TaxID=2126342 RepID=A0A450UNT9_9GAMM|nr:MAG: hypothetical protein BECKLFY1418A_GA0070994_103812 [Candidatus Kentron sp. LFY]
MNDSWKSPTTVIGIAGLIVSICVNIYQFTSSENKAKFEKEKYERQMALKKDKWASEKKKLEEEVEKYKTQKKDNDLLRSDLKKVRKDIAIWENALFVDRLNLLRMRNKIPTEEGPLRDAAEKNIKLQEQMIAEKERNLEASIKRRSEIEAILQKCG